MTPYLWRLRPFAQHETSLTAALPELLALQTIVEQSDWHDDSPFTQSVRLHDWIVALPDALFHTISLPPKPLMTLLYQSPGLEPGAHTIQALLAFVALIHDVGKAATFQTHPDGSTSCSGHEMISGHLSAIICGRLPLPLLKPISSPPWWRNTATLCPQQTPLAEQQAQKQQFLTLQGVYLRPLLPFAYGDFITSHSRPVVTQANTRPFAPFTTSGFTNSGLVKHPPPPALMCNCARNAQPSPRSPAEAETGGVPQPAVMSIGIITSQIVATGITPVNCR